MVAAGAKVAFAQAYWYTFLSLSSGAFRRTIYLTVFSSEMSFVVVWKGGKPFESRPATVTRASLRRASPAHSFPVLHLSISIISLSLSLPCFSSDLQQSHAHFQKETPSTPSALIIALFSPDKHSEPSPPSPPCSAPSPTSSSQARPA